MDNQRLPFEDGSERHQQAQLYASNPYSSLDPPFPWQRAGEKLVPPASRNSANISTLLKLLPPLLILLLLAFLFSGGGNVVKQIVLAKNTSTQTIAVSQPERLIIHDESGQVHIHSGSTGPVTVKATKYFSDWDLRANTMSVDARAANNGRSVIIDALRSDTSTRSAEQGVDLDVTVPDRIAVFVTAAHGSVHIDGINGRMNVEASNSIDAQNVRSDAGPIVFTAHTGGISVDQISGEVEFVTSTGQIEVGNAQLSGDSRLHTQDGKIVFDGNINPEGEYRFSSRTGSITLSLQPDASFHLHASTEQGAFDNEFDSDRVGPAPRAPLTVATISGNIEIDESN